MSEINDIAESLAKEYMEMAFEVSERRAELIIQFIKGDDDKEKKKQVISKFFEKTDKYSEELNKKCMRMIIQEFENLGEEERIKGLKLSTNKMENYRRVGEKGYIDDREFENVFAEIIDLFKEDAGGELDDCYSRFDRLFISGHIKDESNDLMLRYNHGIDNDLVVARVCFIHRREGKMTKLYHLLKKIQKEYQTGAIIIEQAGTTEIKSWCEKNNFAEKMFVRNNYVEMDSAV